MNSTALEANNDGPGAETSTGLYRYSIGICFGVVIFLIILTYCYYIYRRYNQAGNNSHHHFQGRATTPAAATDDEDDPVSSITVEVYETTFEKCPKLPYSQAKDRGDGRTAMAASSCSICLQEYNESDMLRLLPECGHFFHLKCVDPWLKLHFTCPICRNSPFLSSLDCHS